MRYHLMRKSILFVSAILLAYGFVFVGGVGEKIPLAQGEESVAMAADIQSSIQISLSEGTNQSGKKTYLVGNSINFGEISFIHPELTSNGDAYLENGHLKLEAVLNVGVVFSGASQAMLDVTRLLASTNPFTKTYYSLSINRSDTLSEVYDEPRSNRLTTITESATIPVRLVLEIKPQQQGKLSDHFRLETTTL